MARSRFIASLFAASLACSASSSEAQRLEALPWETWGDLHRLAELHAGHQALLRSSRCPDGCRFDRHSDGDWRYLYTDGDEGVIFEEAGAGAITRIWMTMGSGVSVPLEPAVRLRVYLDGAASPAVDVSLPALFDGSTPPFVPPLVGHRETSSGGNFSYVPIPYRDGCRVTLVGAHQERIWYQVNFHRLHNADGVDTFDGTEDLAGLAGLLTLQGEDPWPPGSGDTQAGAATLDPGAERQLFAALDPGSVTAIRLEAPPARRSDLELRLTFDGETTARMTLDDFFAVGRGGPLPTRSLLLGVDAEGLLYSYFPMPFFESAEIALANRGAEPVPVAWQVRAAREAPVERSGLFGAHLRTSEATEVGADFPLLSLGGHGKLAATFFELGSTGRTVRDYLEGDERIFIDGSRHPAVYGTGVEDHFNGGFYFDHGPLSSALHGAPYTDLEVDGLATTAAYRLMLTDAITFEHRLVAGLESGPTNNVPMRARTVSYFYRRRPPRLHVWDRLDLGSAADRERHAYTVEGPHALRTLDALFEDQPPSHAVGSGVYRPPGRASFVLRGPPGSNHLRLRRRLDAGTGGQRAAILIDGRRVGAFGPVDANPHRRWREVDVGLDASIPASGELALTVVAESGGGGDELTAFRYQLWAEGPATVFLDGFESGSVSAWTASR